MKVSKASFQRIESLISKFTKSEGITSMPVERALKCLSEGDLNKLSEYEAAIIYDSINESEKDLSENEEIKHLHLSLETLWALRATKSGTKIPKEFRIKTLH